MPEETELIGGPEKREIVIVEYDPTWPDRFAAERARIVGALGSSARRVDHIGSTAVPGLAAKPIIDIDLSVRDPDDEPSYLPALERAGYRLRVRQPGHRMVRTAALKRALAEREWADMNAYAEAKGALIAEITARAQVWERAVGRQPASRRSP